jgi:hypothetical protein
MPALHELISRYRADVAAHLDRDADIPVLTGPQAQGDVAIRPVRRWPVPASGSRSRGRRAASHFRRRAAAVTPIPASGLVVAMGREGHEHRLLPGPARFDLVRPSPDELLIGILTVPAGGEAYLAHDQHGYLGIGPGTYEVGGQREWTPPPRRKPRQSIWQRVMD